MQYTSSQHRDLYLLTEYLDEVRYCQSEFDRALHQIDIEDLMRDCFEQYYIFLADSFSLEQWYDLFRERCYAFASQKGLSDKEAKEVVNGEIRDYDFTCFCYRILEQPELTPRNHSLKYIKL